MGASTARQDLTAEKQLNIRKAMFSIYHRSLARQWESTGAPAILLPLEVQSLAYAQALDVLRPFPGRLAQAVWCIVRSVPLLPEGDPRPNEVHLRYPGALIDLVGARWLVEVEQRRRAYRRGASVFAAALDARADGRNDVARRLLRILRKHDRGAARTSPGTFSTAVDRTFGLEPGPFLRALFDERSTRTRKDRKSPGEQLAFLENQLGRSSHGFAVDFADTAAFQDCVSTFDLRDADGRRKPGSARAPALGEAGRGTEDAGAVTVQPISSTIVQNTATLTTTTTVTTVARGPFALLARAIDPLNWPIASDVFRSTAYVDDPISLRDDPRGGPREEDARLLREKVAFTWGVDSDQSGEFDTVLNTSYKAVDPVVTLRFSLCRSISSRVLWDERAGGLVLDDGFILARPVSDGIWRVTSRKTLRFSDRTPGLSRPGWLDQGKLLNYLAPAGMRWWMESETYSLASVAYAGNSDRPGEGGRDGCRRRGA
jgi:hypothetical protein